MVKYNERGAGVYLCTFTKLDTDFKITDQETGQEVTRWRWVFTEQATGEELDTITSPGFKARSNGMKFFTGMLGRPPTENDDTDDQIGQPFNVVYGPNQNGRLTITGVIRVATTDNFIPAANPTPVKTGAELP